MRRLVFESFMYLLILFTFTAENIKNLKPTDDRTKIYAKTFEHQTLRRNERFQSQETRSARKGNRFEGVNNFEYEVEFRILIQLSSFMKTFKLEPTTG